MTELRFTPPAKKDEKPIDTIRGQMKDLVKEIPQLENLIEIVAEGCNAKRKIRIVGQECYKCAFKCHHERFVEVNDVKVARETLAFVIDQVEGRPGTAAAESQQVIVQRVVYGVDE